MGFIVCLLVHNPHEQKTHGLREPQPNEEVNLAIVWGHKLALRVSWAQYGLYTHVQTNREWGMRMA